MLRRPHHSGLVFLCIAALLLSQLLGLHHHQHISGSGPSDAGLLTAVGDWHVGLLHPDAHNHLADGHGDLSHLDVEADTLKAGFAKWLPDAVVVAAVPLAGWVLALPIIGWCGVPRAACRARGLSPFALTPPSQAPPR